jgi:hypothetical protein
MLIGIVHRVEPFQRIFHERSLLMLILKVFKLTANMFEFLKRMLPGRLIFWFLRATHGRPGRCPEAPACNRLARDHPNRCPETPAVPALTAAASWRWRLRGRGFFVSEKPCQLTEWQPGCCLSGGGR